MSSLQNAAALFGIPSQLPASATAVQNIVVDTAAPVDETVTVSHNGRETVPGTIELTAGKNYTLTILPTSNGIGCMSMLVIPTIDKTVHRIIKDQPIVYTLPNLQP